ncbi:MAG: glutathione S-transferase N-terminal domain-containing protein [Giesbergeria sp.]|jgi:glutaredoxin|nr:glutathione S-transferase N-terminal domain-containing protein [Giesbergeria sp.]MBP6160646.1 glutathione S-transferase N-terminal domain-containing protein [Giesbergeria sp.]MBP7082757.1 glutathione S-transferase N-terminal domain-containing protein [Giesbergeria sp.]MBP9784167.1 glutathione S-transferase N-terminal domain-containing protein [Giesbergeria sp.]MBP9895202.1 glutathione S-transferase N-terminal domain-containing protein [Giesbergeria sp.]
MKSVVRYFFRTLRVLLGPVMLLKEALTRPQGVVRTSAEQASVDAACRGLALYQYKTCPFCIKTRQEMRRLSLDIAKVDAQHAGPARTELLQGGGQTKVPCLKITDAAGSSRWLYDSEKIIAYLRSRFAPA